MHIIKINDWIKDRPQFEKIYSRKGNIYSAKRLKDSKRFNSIFRTYIQNNVDAHILSFNDDLIHINVEIEIAGRRLTTFICKINDYEEKLKNVWVSDECINEFMK